MAGVRRIPEDVIQKEVRRTYFPHEPYCVAEPSTVEPLLIESLCAENRVSTWALGALDDQLVVQTKIWKTGSVPVDNTQRL